jgi:hypothetical protein
MVEYLICPFAETCHIFGIYLNDEMIKEDPDNKKNKILKKLEEIDSRSR